MAPWPPPKTKLGVREWRLTPFVLMLPGLLFESPPQTTSIKQLFQAALSSSSFSFSFFLSSKQLFEADAALLISVASVEGFLQEEEGEEGSQEEEEEGMQL